MPSWMEQAVLGMGFFQAWWTVSHQIIWMLLVAYAVIAGWSDLRTRRIPNQLTLGALMLFLSVQFIDGDGLQATLGFMFVGFLLFWPTFARLWGQGDWKMSMVYGAVLGLLPVLALWFAALVFAKVGDRRIKLWSQEVLHVRQVESIPLGFFIMLITILVYFGGVIIALR